MLVNFYVPVEPKDVPSKIPDSETLIDMIKDNAWVFYSLNHAKEEMCQEEQFWDHENEQYYDHMEIWHISAIISNAEQIILNYNWAIEGEADNCLLPDIEFSSAQLVEKYRINLPSKDK